MDAASVRRAVPLVGGPVRESELRAKAARRVLARAHYNHHPTNTQVRPRPYRMSLDVN